MQPIPIVGWDYDGQTDDASLGVNTAGATSSAIGGVTASYIANGAGFALTMSGFPGGTSSNASAGVRYCFDTTGYMPVKASFGIRMSNTGSRFKALQHRVYPDGAWSDVAIVASITVAGGLDAYTVMLPTVAGFAFNPQLCLRLVTVFEPGASAYSAAQTVSTRLVTG